MTIRRITISVPEAVARKIKRAAGREPVSSWLTEVIEEHLDVRELERAWALFCRDVKPTRADAKRADAMFARLTKRKRSAA
ncbi:MAG TPA: hypothetical protein VGH87_12145 [Polyangiaceae bacterium]|jgi:hypothetical protein|nr:hypothetical protein [Polyangiaceae bacterium]